MLPLALQHLTFGFLLCLFPPQWHAKRKTFLPPQIYSLKKSCVSSRKNYPKSHWKLCISSERKLCYPYFLKKKSNCDNLMDIKSMDMCLLASVHRRLSWWICLSLSHIIVISSMWSEVDHQRVYKLFQTERLEYYQSMPAFYKSRPLHFGNNLPFIFYLWFTSGIYWVLFLEHVCWTYHRSWILLWILRREADLQESLNQVHPGIGSAGIVHLLASYTLRGKPILDTKRTSQNFSQSQSENLNRIGVTHGTPWEMKVKAQAEDSLCQSAWQGGHGH